MSPRPPPAAHPLVPLSRAAIRHAALAGCCATLVGIGLARFAYTPLIPALAAEHWFTASGAAYLGAANLAGYLVGALGGHRLARYLPARTLLRLMMMLTVASLFACDLRALGFAWFFFWRFLSGCTGGVIMVLAAPTVLLATPPERRGLVGGAVFTGIGLGVAISGTLVPVCLAYGGVAAGWLGLGALALALSILGWSGWPEEAPAAPEARVSASQSRLPLAATAVLVEYGLNAVGLVPHMIFLVVFVSVGLGQGVNAGSAYWVVYGIGAMGGPLLAGRLADRVGFRTALRLAYAIEAAGVALPVLTDASAALALSSLIAGAFTPGIVPLALGRIHELIASEETRRRTWGRTTTAWAVSQAVAAYVYSYLFGRYESYLLLFALGTLALLLALALNFAVAARSAGSPT